MMQVVYREHQCYKDAKTGALEEEELKRILRTHNVDLRNYDNGYMDAPTHLDLSSDLQASYFIGADWLVEKELSLIVLPKIDRIDFVQMLLCALSVEGQDEVDYFAQCYGIEMNQPPIETDAAQSYINPILLIHYLSLLERVVKYGLRKDYQMDENNLKGKIKGHLLFSRHIRQNVITKCEYMTYCRYQIFTEDIPINRLLKKALVFAQRMLQECMTTNENYVFLHARINRLMTAFDRVSDDVEVSKVQHIPQNAMYRYYSETINVAKMILKRYDYSISNISQVNYVTQPFWIDMSRLFEMYVLSILRKEFGRQILFQVSGFGKCKADFVHLGEKLIMDAKYKPQYSKGVILEDIREISGYARDRKILDAMGVKDGDNEVGCVIIYPIDAGDNRDVKTISLWEQALVISEFRNFRKIGVTVPIV